MFSFQHRYCHCSKAPTVLNERRCKKRECARSTVFYRKGSLTVNLRAFYLLFSGMRVVEHMFTMRAVLLCLFVAATSSIPIDNGLEGEPEIECGPRGIAVNFATQNPFGGVVYVKGRHAEVSDLIYNRIESGWVRDERRQPPIGVDDRARLRTVRHAATTQRWSMEK